MALSMVTESHTAIWAFDKEIKVFHILYNICAVCRSNGKNDAWNDIEREGESKKGWAGKGMAETEKVRQI